VTSVAVDVSPRAARSSGCISSWCRSRPLVRRSLLCIQELQSCWCRRPISSSSPSAGAAWRAAGPGRRAPAAGAASIRLSFVMQPLGQLAGLQRAEVDARPGDFRSSLRRHAERPRAAAGDQEGRARRSRASSSSRFFSDGLRSSRAVVRRPISRKICQSCRWSGLGEDRRREPRGVADREQVEDQVVVVALERRRRRQDHVGVPGGLVDVDVDGGHEVEPERPVQPLPSGVESTGLPATVSSARIWPSPGVSISSRSTDTGSSPPNSGSPRTRLTPERRCARARAARADRVDRRARQHHAALAVEVAGQQVEQLQRPLADRAELVRRHPHPAVRRGAVGAVRTRVAIRRIVAAGTPLIARRARG
jgi:hypothetical protein